MTSIFLSCYDLPIIKQVAQLLGLIMNLLYEFFSIFGIYNIGLCIILFTIIVKMILLPMTIKQQKFTKLSSVMNPEIQAIQKKYANKRDQESTMKMNQELSAVYEKYGTTPTGGCLSLLIQMPILFALYGVISQLPIFINDVGTYFENAGAIVAESQDYLKDIDKLDELLFNTEESDLDYLVNFIGEDKEATADAVYGAFSTIAASPAAIWSDIFSAYDESENLIVKFEELSEEDWDNVIASCESESNISLLKEYKDFDWTLIKSELKADKSQLTDIKEEAEGPYSFFGADLSKSPSNTGNLWKFIIPILAAATQLLSVKVSNKYNGQNTQSNQSAADNPMASSMKSMMYVMPIMSAIFCFTLPSGLGLYWIMSAVVQTVQTIFIAKYFIKVDVNDLIKANIEKLNKKREKQGLPPKKITTAATTNVKNIKVEEKQVEDKKPVQSTSGKKSISAKANLVEKYNKK